MNSKTEKRKYYDLLRLLEATVKTYCDYTVNINKEFPTEYNSILQNPEVIVDVHMNKTPNGIIPFKFIKITATRINPQTKSEEEEIIYYASSYFSSEAEYLNEYVWKIDLVKTVITNAMILLYHNAKLREKFENVPETLPKNKSNLLIV